MYTITDPKGRVLADAGTLEAARDAIRDTDNIIVYPQTVVESFDDGAFRAEAIRNEAEWTAQPRQWIVQFSRTVPTTGIDDTRQSGSVTVLARSSAHAEALAGSMYPDAEIFDSFLKSEV